MKKAVFISLSLIVSSFSSLFSQTAKMTVQKEPDWITRNNFDYTTTKLDDQAEDGYVNLDFEKQTSLSQQSSYYKKAIRILSEAGVQNRSEINVSFDPSYNQLIFHSIRIIRENKSINKLQPYKIKLVHQETELRKFLYDGAMSAVLFLEDVRKGDIIEYSYTIKGFNPVFENKYSDELSTSYSVPIYNLFYKVIVPASRNIQIKNTISEVSYASKQSGSEKIYEWSLNNLPAVHLQDETPSWYDPYNAILISEFQNWKEVGNWAIKLFPVKVKFSSAMQKKIDEINTRYSKPEEKITAALRFVQDDIRYMGIEMGKNSHQPNAPDKVFNQRFGDCKDKSYLLCTLLRAMNIDAEPVLINTEYKKKLYECLPAPTNFDHVTVRVYLNGKFYWFDPTISFQRGSIDNISYPDYQCGLIISDTTTSLISIPVQEKGMVDIHEVYQVPDLSGRARLIIRTSFSGSFADDVRNDFHNNSVYEMQKRYKDYYGNYYDRISADSLVYADDEVTGKFNTTEYYSIMNLWQFDGTNRKGYFSPYTILNLLKKPQDAHRTMPFEIEYPAHYLEEVEVDLPEDWDVEPAEDNISCPAFKLQTQFWYYNRKLKLRYEYQSLKDHVSADETQDFISSYNRADQHIQYSLSFPDENVRHTTFHSNQGMKNLNKAYLLIAVLILIVAGAWWSRNL
ncbi:MAG: hypothetical protein C5B52_07575 [Bacteroidetes bacterium]|nr:MAG: hypothetical protein C5B52_07575 [Bacteroidota bacterium]